MSGVRLHSAGGGYVEVTAPPGLATGKSVVLPTDTITPGLVLLASAAFTAQAAVQILNVFSAAYDNYKVLLAGVHSSGDYAGFQYGAGGAFSAVSYASAEQYMTSGGTSAATTFATAWLPATTTTGAEATIFSPYLAAYTAHASFGNYAAPGTIIWGGRHSVAASYTDLKLMPATGTITGTIYVYGYRKA